MTDHRSPEVDSVDAADATDDVHIVESTEPDDTNRSGADSTAAPPEGSGRAASLVAHWWRTDLRLYVYSGLITGALVTLTMRLWRASLSTPFYYSGDAVASAEYFKSVLATGWYETQPNLGAPFGQHYHDFPFSDDLNPAMAKLLGLFTGNWAVAFNLYYLLGFVLCALGAVYFLRVCGLSSWMAVALSVLYAVAPYHFIRNENHLFLSSYFCVPLAMVVVLRAVRGEPLWGRRHGVNRWFGLLTGRGGGTVVSVALVTYSGAYYGLFTALLLAPVGLLSLFRSGDRRRFAGVVVAGAVLLVVFVGAMAPDILYEHSHPGNENAFVRTPIAAEVYAFKFTSLIMPAPGHPLAILAKARSLYDDHYPLPGEEAALGLMAAIGFVLLLAMALLALTGAFPGRNATPVQVDRRRLMFDLSTLTWIAFMWGTVGGLSTVLSFATASIRGWNRLSIFIALFALAGLGLALEALCQRIVARRTARRVSPGADQATSRAPRWTKVLLPATAVAVLLIGAADQNIADALPPYQSTATSFASDGAFVADLQARLPAGSMIFQLPYQAFPESDEANGLPESDQLKLFMHSTTLRWSAGGIKGRPQTDWPEKVAGLPATEMTRDVVAIGFAGIVVHRSALPDKGKSLESALTTVLGGPALISNDKQYSYFSLAPAIEQLDATTTATQRAAIAAGITHITP